MMGFPLTLNSLFERAGKVFPDVEIDFSKAGRFHPSLHLQGLAQESAVACRRPSSLGLSKATELQR